MPNKEFKIMVIKRLTGLQRRGRELSKIFNKEMEKKKYISELENTITVIKNKK